jgi:aspartyl aminopeptidase
MTVIPTIDYAKSFIKFVNKAVSPFQAVEEVKSTLLKEGYIEIREKEPTELWKLKQNGKYFVTRNSSSIIAFIIGGKFEETSSHCHFTIIGAHTDSPSLKVKPISLIEKHGFLQLAVETYGAGLW